MSERSDDEQELVELLLMGSLTPREFERAKTALGVTGATSSNTDAGRSAAEPVGVSAAGLATAGSSITDVDSSDGHSHGDTVSTSPEGPSSPRLRPHIPRPMWIVGGSLAAILLIAMVAALAVPATPDETVELRAGQVVTRSEVHVPFWSGKSTELELLASGSEPFEVSWALRRRVNTLDQQLRAAPGEQLVAIWADERPSEVDSIQRLHLLVDGRPHYMAFDRTLGNEAVVASVPAGAELTLQVTQAQATETLDLRRGRTELEAREPSAAIQEDDQATSSSSGGAPTPRPYSVTTPKAMVETGEERRSSQLDDVPTEDARAEDEPHMEPRGGDGPVTDEDPDTGDDRLSGEERGDAEAGTRDGENSDADAGLPTFEGTAAPGASGQELVEFLQRHHQRVVYLDVSTPHPGNDRFSPNSWLVLDDSQLPNVECISCHIQFRFDFFSDDVPASVVASGDIVVIRGHFLVMDAAYGVNSVDLKGVPDANDPYDSQD